MGGATNQKTAIVVGAGAGGVSTAARLAKAGFKVTVLEKNDFIGAELKAHNIFLADEYKESFDSIFKRNLIPSEPSFYVNIPSHPDPTAAPEGKETLVVLVPVRHLLGDHENVTKAATATEKDIQQSNANGKMINSETAQGIKPVETKDWPKMIELARKTILSTIAKCTGVDIAPLIVHEITNERITSRQHSRSGTHGLSSISFILSSVTSKSCRRLSSSAHLV
ncbi:phytoene desaturase, partial [Aureobasidium melanogenum]